MYHVIGVDPGLIDTGIVSLIFMPEKKNIIKDMRVVTGPNANQVQAEVRTLSRAVKDPHIVIEKYRPRQRLNQDHRMVKLEHELRQALPQAVFLQNTGVKSVVSSDLLELIGCNVFPQGTHHQDLKSAARIGILGMLKDPDGNKILADLILDFLEIGKMPTIL